MSSKAKSGDVAQINDPQEWYENHDYDRVMKILRHVREVTLEGPIEKAAENLERAYHFAVLSIKTTRKLHEVAFDMWASGMNVRMAATEVGVFGYNQKSDWIEKTQEEIDWVQLVRGVRKHVEKGKIRKLIGLNEMLSGVSLSKWGFALALAGVWEVVCIDSNVRKFFDIPEEVFENMRRADGADWYMGIVELIDAQIDDDVPPFLKQWVIYDMMRGEHTRHESFFYHAHPFANGEVK